MVCPQHLNICVQNSSLLHLSNCICFFTNDLLPGALFLCAAVQCFPEQTGDREDVDSWMNKEENVTCRFESDEDTTTGLRIPTQAQAIVEGPGSVAVSELQPVPDVDYIQVS